MHSQKMGKDYYNMLGITRSATEAKIEKAYTKLAIKYHPNNKTKTPGAEEKFREVAEAYEVLSNKKRREVYDQYGEEGFGAGGCEGDNVKFVYKFHGDPLATFQQLIDNLFVSSEKRMYLGVNSESTPTFSECNGEDKDFVLADMPEIFQDYDAFPKIGQTINIDPPVEYDAFISLEDIAKGCTKQMKIKRKVTSIDGRTTSQEKVLTFDVKPGWKAGTRITFKYEGDQTPHSIPADVSFILRDELHPLFTREGKDIKFIAEVTLKQALCGTEVEVPSLEGEKTVLKLNYIKPNLMCRIHGQGLPEPGDLLKKGDLVVAFDIKFPESLPDSTLLELEELLL